MSVNGLAIVNLNTGDSWVPQFCPKDEATSLQMNWKENDTTIGVKPLSYANTNPKELSLKEVWLDGTDRGESVEEDIRELESLCRESDRGIPPTLLYIRGSEQLRVVLVQMDVKREMLDRQGNARRAIVSLVFKQHVRVERVRSRVTDPGADAGTFNPLGNF